MWQKLTYKQKSWVLMGAMLSIVCIAFECSFKPALEAIHINRQLQEVQMKDETQTGSFVQLNSQHDFYLEVLKEYKVKNEDRENRLWQAISGMALANDLQISFDPDPTAITDTIVRKNGAIAQQFKFKGSYFKLVKLLDTLSKSNGIGKISQLKLSKQNENELMIAPNSLTLKVTLMALSQ